MPCTVLQSSGCVPLVLWKESWKGFDCLELVKRKHGLRCLEFIDSIKNLVCKVGLIFKKKKKAGLCGYAKLDFVAVHVPAPPGDEEKKQARDET